MENSLQNSPLRDNSSNFDDERSLDPEFLAITGYAHYIYLFLTVFGLTLNSYVLVRLIAQACGDVDRFVDGSGMPLATMIVADLISLLIVFITNVMGSQTVNHSTRLIYCKISMFLIHMMTGVSMWCWMVASGLRFLAVYHPFLHMRRWKLGQRAILIIVVVSAAMNFWLLFAVDISETSCTETDFIFNNDILNRSLHAVEIGWSYLAPALLMAVMDTRVFLTQTPRTIVIPEGTTRENSLIYRNTAVFSDNDNSSDEMCTLKPPSTPRPAIGRQTSVARTAVRHWLMITTVDLLLNAPDTTVRFLTIVGLLCEDCAIPWNPMESCLILSIVIIARLLYFAQFSFNAVFLTAVM